MKTTLKAFGLGMLLWVGIIASVWADPPQPPPPPGGHGHNGPAGAPIDGGLGILLALGAAYGGRKVWMAWTKRRGMRDVNREP